MITEDYVSFETAKLLKEKGFDEGCSFVIHEESKGVMPVSWPTTNSDIEDEKAKLIALPTLQMALKWLRENHDIYIIAEPHYYNGSHADAHVCTYWYNGNFHRPYEEKYPQYHKLFGKVWKTQEEAYDEVIRYCLENLIH